MQRPPPGLNDSSYSPAPRAEKTISEKAAFPESSQYMDFVLKSMGAKKS